MTTKLIMKDLVSFLFKTGKRFRTEELIFGLLAIGTVLLDYSSSVPAIFTCCLLAFYYCFFGWYLFKTQEENHVFFSIISGIIYAACLCGLSLAIVDPFGGLIFLYMQISLFAGLTAFLLFKNDWSGYKKNHFIRIAVLTVLNGIVLLSR